MKKPEKTTFKKPSLIRVNKLTSKIFPPRLAQASLARKNDIVNFVKKTDFDDKVTLLTCWKWIKWNIKKS